MKTNELLYRAENRGCFLECTCVNINQNTWDELMKNNTKANQKQAVKIALLAGVIDEHEAKKEIKNPWYNPYNHYKTKTHLIYVHSCIEHFIKIN